MWVQSDEPRVRARAAPFRRRRRVVLRHRVAGHREATRTTRPRSAGQLDRRPRLPRPRRIDGSGRSARSLAPDPRGSVAPFLPRFGIRGPDLLLVEAVRDRSAPATRRRHCLCPSLTGPRGHPGVDRRRRALRFHHVGGDRRTREAARLARDAKTSGNHLDAPRDRMFRHRHRAGERACTRCHVARCGGLHRGTRRICRLDHPILCPTHLGRSGYLSRRSCHRAGRERRTSNSSPPEPTRVGPDR